MDSGLKLKQPCDIITISSQQYNDLMERIERLESLLLAQRQTAIIQMSSIEDAFGLKRTKPKRIK